MTSDVQAQTDRTIDSFLADLSKLCRKHGVGINGGVPFVMEHEDTQFDHVLDDDTGELRLG